MMYFNTIRTISALLCETKQKQNPKIKKQLWYVENYILEELVVKTKKKF